MSTLREKMMEKPDEYLINIVTHEADEYEEYELSLVKEILVERGVSVLEPIPVMEGHPFK